MQVSGELAEVRDHLLKYQQFSRWMAAIELEYFQTWHVEILRQNFANDGPPPNCNPVIDKLQETASIQERYHLVSYDWVTCQVLGHGHLSDDYPKPAWERWLADNGISMIYVGHIDG